MTVPMNQQLVKDIFPWDQHIQKASITWGFKADQPLPEQSLMSLAFSGGIGEAVTTAVSMESDILVYQMSVPGVPRCGKSGDLVDVFGLSARHIVVAVRCLLVH